MEADKSYESKYANFQKAVNRQEGAYVPNTMCNTGGSIFWSGKTVFDVAADPQAYAEATTKVFGEMWVDGNITSILTTTPRLDGAFPTSENRVAKDGTLTHLQSSPMKADEYDQLIAGPENFIKNVLLPRKHAFLYEDKNAAKEALKVYAEERFGSYVQYMPLLNKMMAEKYGIYSFVNMAGPIVNTPYDDLFDYFRGFRGTLTDLRRQPEKVKAAADALWEYRWADLIQKPYDAKAGYLFQPCHIPAYLSPKQYKELYWPYEKKLIEWIYNSGSKVLVLLEGRWEKVWDCFMDVPKDSCVLCIDDDDFLKAYAALGQQQIICGGLKMADVRLKSFDDLKDGIKNVIDTCAPGGGFLFNTDKGWLTHGDVNQTLIDAYNFAHEYSSR